MERTKDDDLHDLYRQILWDIEGKFDLLRIEKRIFPKSMIREVKNQAEQEMAKIYKAFEDLEGWAE